MWPGSRDYLAVLTYSTAYLYGKAYKRFQTIKMAAKLETACPLATYTQRTQLSSIFFSHHIDSCANCIQTVLHTLYRQEAALAVSVSMPYVIVPLAKLLNSCLGYLSHVRSVQQFAHMLLTAVHSINHGFVYDMPRCCAISAWSD